MAVRFIVSLRPGEGGFPPLLFFIPAHADLLQLFDLRRAQAAFCVTLPLHGKPLAQANAIFRYEIRAYAQIPTVLIAGFCRLPVFFPAAFPCGTPGQAQLCQLSDSLL